MGDKMDRQTLDMEGARFGEVLAASLQLEDHTIAIQRIATMSIESKLFFPWDTPRNKQTRQAYATSFVGMLFFGLICVLAWQFMAGPEALIVLGVGATLVLVGLLCGIRALMIAAKLRSKEPYYQLTIGTSDGRQIALVDDNRDVLTRIRDVVRFKMDTGERETIGDFDLNLDRVNLKTPPASDRAAKAVAVPDPEPAVKTASPMFKTPEPKPDTPEILFGAGDKASKTSS